MIKNPAGSNNQKNTEYLIISQTGQIRWTAYLSGFIARKILLDTSVHNTSDTLKENNFAFCLCPHIQRL